MASETPSLEEIPIAFRAGLSVPKRRQMGHGMRYEHGVPVMRDPVPKPTRTLDTFEEMMATRKMGETLRAPEGKVDDTSLPKHVLVAGQTLAFEGFFKESIVESGLENFRVRRVVFRYFLEDDTCTVTEIKVENSGMDQGAFIKRHQLPAPGGGTLHWTDFHVGEDILLYGRVFRITKANAFTRSYCEDAGVPLAPDADAPSDKYTTLRDTIRMRETGADQTGFYGKKANPMKRFMEAHLGNASAVQIRGIPDAKKKFLEHDREVLAFRGVWDDRSSVYGSKLHFRVHYFLADDTVEVLEVHEPNSGRDKFPQLLARQRLPKGVIYNDDRSRGIEDDNGEGDYYEADDFEVGRTVTILGRDVLLYDADKFTHEWVLENRGVDMRAAVVDVSDPAPTKPVVVPPPPTGYGTEEDSLGSVTHLVPKVPKKDVAKMRRYAGVILRWQASIKDASPIDSVRKFIVAFYPEDDTLQVYEPPQRNTGIIGGKFMAREKITNPDSGAPFRMEDFAEGGEVTVRGQRFVLGPTDERTAKFLAAEAGASA